MGKYFNRALFYRDWKGAKWVFILMLVSIFYAIPFRLLNRLTDYGRGYYETRRLVSSYYWGWFESLVFGSNVILTITLVVLVALLSVVLMRMERENSYYTLTASMPFTRYQVIFSKWITGVISITTAFAINYILIAIIFVANRSIIEGGVVEHIHLFQWLWINTLGYVAIFSFMLFVQTVMGNSTAAGIIGIILLFVPPGFFAMLQNFTAHYGFDSIGGMSFSEIGYRMVIFIYSVATPRPPFYHDIPLRFFILSSILVVFLTLALYVYRKNDFEKNGLLIMFKPLEGFFKVGVSVCLGLLFGAILGIRGNIIVMNLLFLLGGALGWFIASKSISLSRSTLTK